MQGIVLIDKPKGWTSFDVVAKVRNALRAAHGKKIKVGHSGTLDPLATGLLILAVGPATKQISSLMKLDKTYEVEMQLGEVSSTDDAEGKITKKSTQRPTQKQIEDALASFLGSTSQTPPAFSAIKVGGQRAYKLARSGKQVQLEPRQVTIYEIRDTVYDYPLVRFTTVVSSGTYIRSLVRDVGEKLGTGAYMSELRRTRVGDFSIKDAFDIEKDISKIVDNLAIN